MKKDPEVICVICGADTSLLIRDLDEANTVCSEACNDIYIMPHRQSD